MRSFGEAMWVVNILLVGVAAFFGAEGLSAVAKMALLRGMPVSGALPLAAPSPSDPPAHALGSEPILARNPFDSVTGSLLPKPHTDDVPSTEAYDPFHLPACAKVRAVVIAAFADPEASLAAFEVEGGEAVLRRRGGEIGQARVEYIAADRVFVKEDDKMCQAQLFAPTPVVPAKDRTAATPRPADPAGAMDPAIAKGIERLGPGRYRIERSVVDHVLNDQSEIMKGAMMRPEKDGDRTVGVRLFAVRPDRLFGLLGLQDGDVMRSINGYDFSSPERILEAYARLRDATQLRVDFTRGGQATTHTYAIQ